MQLAREFEGNETSRGEERVIKAVEAAFGEALHNPGASSRAQEQGYLASNLVRLVNDSWRKSDDTLWEHRRNWSLNLEFVLGNQWSVWSRRNKRIDRNPKRESKFAPKATFNVMRTIVMTAVSRFMSTRAQILILASSQDQDRIDSASVAQRVIGEYEWIRQNMEEVLAKALYFVVIMGNVFLKVEWDPEDGDELATIPAQAMTGGLDGQEGQMEMDEEGFPSEPQMGGEPMVIRQGNIKTTVIDPQNVKPDTAVLDIEDGAYFIYDADLSPQAVFNTWDVWLAPTPNANQDENFNHRESREARYRDTVKVKEAHIAAGKYPDGSGGVYELKTNKVIVVAEDRLLEFRDSDTPYFPFVHIRCLRNPRELMGDTWLNGLRSPQASLNKTVSVVIQANDLMGAPPWMCPNGANVPAADRQPKAARWIRYDPVMGQFKPEMVQPPTVSLGVFKHLEFLKQIIQELSGQYEGGMKGGAPGGIESGIALESLAERDTTRLYITAQELGRGIEKWARISLDYIQKYWGVERTVAVTGKMQETEVLKFSAADVDSAFQVRVVPDSVIPQMKAAKFQRAMAEQQAGWISIRDAKRITGTDSHEELTLEQIQVNASRNENREAKEQGFISTPIEEMQLHDHLVHAEEHLRRLFSPTCQVGSPEYLALLSHAMWHIQQFNMSVAPPPPPMPPGEGEGEDGPPPADSGEEAQ